MVKDLPAQAGTGALSVTELSYQTRFYLQASAEGGIRLVLAKAGAEISEASTQRVEFQLCQTVDLLDCVE